jgi:oligopeptide/dipeptide ABC transporter ATP-binding protein
MLEVRELRKYFPLTKGFFRREVGHVRAVDGVTLVVKRGETLGLVGESGCGKTTLGRCILQVIPVTSGTTFFEGEEISFSNHLRPRSLSAKMQAIFQDPYSSMNPRQKVKDIIAEPLVIQGNRSKRDIDDRLSALYELVGLKKEMGERYPHMLSGGEQQRVCIARAMAVQPRFILCDEPVSSLDVSIRAQIINLLESLQEELEVSYLFISHDLSVVHHISDTVAVMYLGKIVEISPKRQLYNDPLHPYTRALISAIPIPDPDLERKRQRILIDGEVPSALTVLPGCRFQARCQQAKRQCAEEEPKLREVEPRHWVACHPV